MATDGRRERDEPRLARGRRARPRRLPAVHPARRDGQGVRRRHRRSGRRRTPPRSSTRRSTRAWRPPPSTSRSSATRFPTWPRARVTAMRRRTSRPRATGSGRRATARWSSTQLRGLSRTLTSPTAAGGEATGSSVGLMGDYLDELGAAFPAARDAAAFQSARAAATRLEQKVSIAAALDLSSGLSDLATWFEANHPEATLVPQSLAGTTEAKQRRAEMEATFGRLETELNGLSTTFATRSDDLFVPVGLTGHGRRRPVQGRHRLRGRRPQHDPVLPHDHGRPVLPVRVRGRARRRRTSSPRPRPASAPHAGAYLGGPTAEFADVQAVLARDFQQVAIVTIIGILVVLVLLLRAVVAPLYLVGTVLLSCATALGLSAWFFQSVLGQAGVSFYLPLLVFVLLVALGSDYNIFLMSRVREESEARPIRDGIRIASGRTGRRHHLGRPHPRRHVRVDGHRAPDRPRPGRCDRRRRRAHRHVHRALDPRPGDRHARRRVVLVAVRGSRARADRLADHGRHPGP